MFPVASGARSLLVLIRLVLLVPIRKPADLRQFDDELSFTTAGFLG